MVASRSRFASIVLIDFTFSVKTVTDMKSCLAVLLSLCSFISILRAQGQNGNGDQAAINALNQPGYGAGFGCPELFYPNPNVGCAQPVYPEPLCNGNPQAGAPGQNGAQTIGAGSGQGAGAGTNQGAGQGQANSAGRDQCINLKNQPKINIQNNYS